VLAHQHPGDTARKVAEDAVLRRGVVPDAGKRESSLRFELACRTLELSRLTALALRRGALARTFPFVADIADD
jgi:hypothetical protein